MLIKRPAISRPVSAVNAASKPIKPAAKPAAAPAEAETRATKSVTTRMPPATLDMLDSIVATYESDRTEVIKRAIRLLNAALSGHNAVVIISDRAGKAKELNLKIDGVPT
jgi:hypothetical protein